MTAARLRLAFVGATLTWAVLLVAVPFAASRPHASPLAAALIAGVYAIGSLVCHQLPERSYRLWTAQMPVCARCTGIYFGAVLGAIASALRAAGTFRTAKAVRHTTTEGAGEAEGAGDGGQVAQGFSPASRPRLFLALAAAPAAASLAYEWTTGDRPSHEIRAASGAAIGFVVAWLVVAATENQVN